MSTGTHIDTSKLDNVLKKLLSEVKNPSVELRKVGTAILVPAIKKNFTTKGAYFGDSWPEVSDFMVAVRKWQGHNKYATQGPLHATGQLKKSWQAVMETPTRLVVGSTMAHAESLQEGRPGTGVFTQKGGGGKTWTHKFKDVREFHILPSDQQLPKDVMEDIRKKLMKRLEEVTK